MAPRAQKFAMLLVALLHVAAPQTSDDLVVRVTQGALRGRRVQREPGATLRSFYAFEGVPYARPPVGERRFKAPQEPESWTGVRNATTFGPNCVQKNIDTGNVTGEEDCLYLNVYTADPPQSWTTVKRPVVVYIHEGGFVEWSGDTDAVRPDPLLRQEVLYVSLNYRLAVMGFLNTEDSQAPGNAGLKDQNMALRWVQRNVAAFGGDPNKVTIMGESAGAGSVHFHMLSPLSRGLFHRAISLSGTVLSRWATVDRPRQYALALRRRWASACPADAPDAIVSCLRRIDASELVFNQYDVPLEPFQNYFLKNTFVPSIEAPASSNSPFLTEDPERLLKGGRFSRVPYMTGHTSGEGILYLAFSTLLVAPEAWKEIDRNFEDIFRWDLPEGVPRTRETMRRVRKFYFGDRSLRNANEDVEMMNIFVKMCTDIYFGVGTVTSAKLMAEKRGTVYVYQFSRDGPIGFIKEALNASHIPGVIHGDDLAYVFDFANPSTGELFPVPASEQPIRERQQKIIANFAKSGNPTPEGSGLIQWPLYSPQRERYLDMGENLHVRNHVLGERTAFWRRLATTTHIATETTEGTTGTSVLPSTRGRKA